MGGDAGSMLGNIAGRALGVLSALPSRGGGFSNLANYMARRQAALADPAFRASLAGSPFSAGFYQVGGGEQAGPGTYKPVAPPSDFMGPTIPAPAGPMDVQYMPGMRRWQPNLPPLSPEVALQQEAYQRTLADLQSPDLAARARAKQAAKIPLLPEEQQALIAGASEFMQTAPPGSTVSISPGGVTYSIGSPYFTPAGAVKTPAQGEMPLEQLQPQLLPGQVPQQTGRTDAEGRPLYQAVVPPKVDLRPPTLPPLGGPPAAAPTPAAPPAAAPGKLDVYAPIFRQIEATRNPPLPPGTLSGLAEHESGGNPLAANPDSSARGLFQITRDTARAWGISADDRYDPIKSAIATANTLAARAREVGLERAIGMHYGGPGAPWEQKVGPSGLSPMQFATSVLHKAQKYAGAVTAPLANVGVAYAAEPPPPPPSAPPPSPPVAVAQAPIIQPPAAVQVAAAAPSPAPQGLVGYPPPAPVVPQPSVPTGIVLPPEAGVQLVPPGGPAPILGPGGLPIESVTIESQEGEKRTAKAPADLAAAQREAVMKADIERLRGAGTAEDQKVLNSLYNYRTKLAEFKAEFPTPADREPWVGKPTRQFLAGIAERFQEPEKKRVAFQDAVGPFSLKAFETSGASMSPNEEAMILPNLPHGQEASATRFEDKLGRFEDGLEAAIAFRTTISRLPVEQRTPEVLNAVQNQIMQQQQTRRAAREEAATQGAAAAAPPAAAPPPPAATAPVVVPAPSPPTTWPPEATAPPPEAAAAGVPATLAQTRDVLLPQRSFWSQLPSVGGAVAGGATGAALGAPFLPPVGPIVGGLIGAGLGAGAGEAAQVGGERLLGAAPAEPGTLLERGGRAAARGAVGEALGAPLRLGSWLVTSRAAPVVEAARDLAPVLRQDLPAATKAVETTAGTFHRIGRLLKDPEALAAAELTPESQQTLLRAWWGQVAAKKPEKIVEAWDAFGPEAQAVLAGPQRAAMDTVMDTLKTGATPFDWGTLFSGSALGAVSAVAGHPGIGAVVAGAPAAVAVGREAARVVPRLATSRLVTPAGAEWLAGLPLAGEVAPPWAMGVPLRAATQVPTALLWPQAAP
jgi:hypothetical protein